MEAKVVASEAIIKRVEELKNLIMEELNVKNIFFTTQRSVLVDYVVKPIPELLGKKYGRLFPKIQKAIMEMEPKKVIDALKADGELELTIDEQKVRILPEEIKILEQPKSGYSISEEDNILVGVSVIIPENLKMEGLARDIVRRIQNQRKEAGFNIADLIETYYEAGPTLTKVFGVISVSPAIEVNNSLEDIIECSLSLVKNNVKGPVRFAVRARRVKSYKLTSKDIERIIGDVILREIPDLKVIIAGAGNIKKYINLQKKEDLSKLEIYNQFIPDEDVPKFFQRAEIVVLPYIEATQSGPLHIAYAFKKPVVATNVGAIPEVVENGKTGLLVPPRDERALSKAIVELLRDDKLKKKMGKRAYEKIKKLSWKNIAKETIKIYKEVLDIWDR